MMVDDGRWVDAYPAHFAEGTFMDPVFSQLRDGLV